MIVDCYPQTDRIRKYSIFLLAMIILCYIYTVVKLVLTHKILLHILTQ
jgi:inner membrane protein involved in colicin E2 resistance